MSPRAVQPLSGPYRPPLTQLFLLWARRQLASPTMGGSLRHAGPLAGGSGDQPRPRERAVSAPQARSGLTPPTLFGSFAAGGRCSSPSAERGQPPRIPAYSSPRLVREAQGFRLPIASGQADPPVAALLSPCGVTSLLRRRLRSDGAPLLRIIVRPRRSTRTKRPTSWL
ncbi:hypothetical protein NDU88_008803 [Pleurodeles waltl]|uniref:Uncharacterized protein n=1 Tax=Pleurodeles waltl TaxID=8319 RepID=A0AAV7RZ51_PLEWA|nr:hypothetical protein NDU88_008803 [Pleurodeles waltl]